MNALIALAGPGVALVIGLLLLRQFEKLMPFPSPKAIAVSLGEETLRQHLGFDNIALQEFGVTIRALAPKQHVCLLVNGLDQSETFRVVEILSVIRWLSLRCSEPLTTVVSIDPLFASGALLVANRDLFEHIEQIHEFSSDSQRPLSHG